METPRKPQQFDDFYLSDDVLNALRSIDYVEPTPVQQETIPLILAGIDLIVQSQTGTGKTAAFAIPIVEMFDPNPGNVDVLVLTPTRELAKQVCREFERVGQVKGLKATAIYGGTSYQKQYDALEESQFVVATPGRLLDLLERGKLDLDNLRLFGLDEADEMLSMGFREELEAIVDYLPEDRQTLLFSATVNESIKSLAKGMLFYPEYISLSSDTVAAETVQHEYYSIDGVGRQRDLTKILEYEEPENAIIFANTKADTFTVTDYLKGQGYNAEVINGDLPQKEREKTLKAVREGDVDYLVATDVAARGIDISDLGYVINYVLPQSAEVYVHRTGRTGRIGKKGKAISLVSPAEMASMLELRQTYDIQPEKREMPTTEQIVEAKQKRYVQDLRQKLMGLRPLPYGGKLHMARHLLDGGDDVDEEQINFVAKLLTVADEVLESDEVREALTRFPGDVPAAPPAVSETTTPKPGPEAKSRTKKEAKKEPKKEPKEKAAKEPTKKPEKKPEKKKAKEKPETPEKPRRKRARSSEGETKTPKRTRSKSGDEQKAAKSNGSSDGKRRRRRRSSSDQQQDQKSNGQTSDGRKRARGSSATPTKKKKKREKTSSEPETSQVQENGQVADVDTQEEQDDEGLRLSRASEEHDMSKMYMDIGRDHFDSSDELLETICIMSGMGEEDFGQVVLKSRYSFVEVRKDYFYDVIKALNNREYEGKTLTAEPARS